jgi:DNA-binding transcriptional ArsR family regulator
MVMRDPDPLLDQQASRLKALGHPARLGILRLVVQGPREGTPVGEIQAGLGIPGSTLSHHLSELAQAGLLKATRQGTIIRYAVCFDTLKALTAYVWENCCGGGARDAICC